MSAYLSPTAKRDKSRLLDMSTNARMSLLKYAMGDKSAIDSGKEEEEEKKSINTKKMSKLASFDINLVPLDKFESAHPKEDNSPDFTPPVNNFADETETVKLIADSPYVLGDKIPNLCECGYPCFVGKLVCEKCEESNVKHYEDEIYTKSSSTTKDGEKKLKKYFCTIFGKEMYLYKSKSDENNHRSMYTLTNAFVKSELKESFNDKKIYLYPFKLIFPNS